MVKKILVMGVIILFIGLAIQQSVATVQPKLEINIKPKDYLFQTIIDIANNLEVKELYKRYDNDLFKVDIHRSIYRKLFLRNPRLLFDILFIKPSMTIVYLNKCYNKGIAITNIIGEDKVLESMENVEITDTRMFDEFNAIISKDEELSSRLEILKEMNKEFNSIGYPILCGIIILVILVVLTPINFIILPFLVYSLILFEKILNLIGIAGLFVQMGFLLLYINFILFLLFVNLCYLY